VHHGMRATLIISRFRWAVCQMDTLKQCRKARDIKVALEQLPRTLDATYARTLAQIDERDYEDAVSILQWLAFSQRPLTLAEIAEAAVTRPTEESFDADDRLLHVTEVLRICHSLVSLSAEVGITQRNRNRTSHSHPTKTISNQREGAQIVRFSHFSVQEYLLSDRAGQFRITETAAHAYIGGSCISYLLRTDNAEPLFRYAARYWYNHIQLVDRINQKLSDLVYTMFQPESFSRRTYCWLHEYEPATQMSKIYDDFPGPLFYSTLFGFLEITERLLVSGVEVNELHRIDFAVQFVKHRFAPGSLDARSCTALEIAAFKGHSDIVELLLIYGANCNADSDHGSILQRTLATESLHKTAADTKRIAMMLLKHGADVRASGSNEWRAPLVSAAAAGHCEVVQFLVRRGTRYDLYAEALQIAAANKHEDIVQFLLDQRTYLAEFGVLQATARTGNHVLIESLNKQLKNNNDTEYLREFGLRVVQLMLLKAARKDDIHLIRNLVESYSKGAPRSFCGVTDHALEEAVRFNGFEITEFLMSPQAVHLVSQNGLNIALHEAAREGNAAIVKLALHAGADANSLLQDQFGLSQVTPLESIIHYGSDTASEALDVLLRAGARLDACTNISSEKALQVVSKRGTLGLVKTLLKHNIDPDARTEGTNTPLIRAVQVGNEQIAEQLLMAGADIHAPVYQMLFWYKPSVRTSFTVLHLAETVSMIELLLRFNADINRGEPGPIKHAIRCHQKWKYDFLLRHA
jgi:ankyrin repeat protein